MEVNLYKHKDIVKTVRENITLGEFYQLLHTYKPTEFYNTMYSEKTPCYYITEYLNANTVMYYANSWADKTPRKITIEQLYSTWLIEGMNYTKFYVTEDKEDWGQGKRQNQYEYSMKATVGAFIVLAMVIFCYALYRSLVG